MMDRQPDAKRQWIQVAKICVKGYVHFVSNFVDKGTTGIGHAKVVPT